MVGIRRRRFGSDDGVAVMVGASRRMRQYGTSQYGTVLQYGIVILQYCMVHNLLSIKNTLTILSACGGFLSSQYGTVQYNITIWYGNIAILYGTQLTLY
jgi:hypothetical protein